MKKVFIIFIACLIPHWILADDDCRDIPLDHWSYPVLERYQAKGYIDLPLTRPFQRRQVIDQLQNLLRQQMDGGIVLSDADRHYFDKLSQEMGIGVSETRLAERDMISFDDGNVLFAADASFGINVSTTKATSPYSRGIAGIEGWGSILGLFIFDQQINLALEKEEEKVEKISGSLTTWRGGKYTTGWSYFRTSRQYISVTLGKQQRWWGPGRFGTLILSDNSGGFDAVDVSMNYRKLEFQSFFGVLSTDLQRYISGHRLGIKLPHKVGLDFSETVVYQANHIDPAYMNPLLPYYANQWNLRDDDNVLWSADVSWKPGIGFSLYGELLMDDVQYEQDPPAPQKMGFLLGGQWADPCGLSDTDLKLEWAGNQKWVYTHRRYVNRYVGADTVNFLGHWIGTDADVLNVTLEHRFHPRLNAGLGYQMQRHGEGRIDRGYLEGDDPHTTFLSGNFSRQDKTNIFIQWEPYYWANIGTDLWISYIKNKDNIPKNGLNDRGINLSLRIDF
jgi:hypothetical protein